MDDHLPAGATGHLADGLARSGFIKWFAMFVADHIGGLPPTVMIVALVSVYFFSHYMFASLTAHTTAMLPVVLAVGMGNQGIAAGQICTGARIDDRHHGGNHPVCHRGRAALLQQRLHHIAGILADWERLGIIFLATLLCIGVPLLML